MYHDAYKIGYLRSTLKNIIWVIERGNPERAKQIAEDALKKILANELDID